MQAAVVEVPCGCDTGSGLVILARSTIAISHCQTACKSRTSRTIAARRCDGREAASRRGVLKNFPQRSTETRRRRRRYSDAAASGRVNRCGYRHPPHVAAGIGTSNFTTQTRNILLLCRHSLNCKTLCHFVASHARLIFSLSRIVCTQCIDAAYCYRRRPLRGLCVCVCWMHR